MYNSGRGVPQDYTQAFIWYRLAADQGYAAAQYNLGVLYDTGQGVPQDDVEALKWSNLAASRATGDHQTRYADARDVVVKEMPPAQIVSPTH